MSNRVINRMVFEQIRQLFLNYYTGNETPEELTREYAVDEYLMVVDMDGMPSRPTQLMLDQYHDLVHRHPAFGRWFREDTLREGEHTGAPVLLAARWLCHLIGLRHGTVEIFIDPPGEAGQTYVQVRGMDKFEAPGAFDIPCAGHISGTDGYEESLRKELGEELNLRLEDLDGLCMVERYNSFGEEHGDGPINNEHRVLYQARLKPDAAARIRFVDGEVAGLSIFSVPELRELVKRYPDRVASGLSDALGYYKGRKGA